MEPHLQPITGEAPSSSSVIMLGGARLDIAASGLWGGQFERTFLDVHVFNPHSVSNHGCQLSSCYRKHKNTKSGHTTNATARLNMGWPPLPPGGWLRRPPDSTRGLHIPSRSKKGPELQLHHHMAQIPALIFVPPLGHQVHQR